MDRCPWCLQLPPKSVFCLEGCFCLSAAALNFPTWLVWTIRELPMGNRYRYFIFCLEQGSTFPFAHRCDIHGCSCSNLGFVLLRKLSHLSQIYLIRTEVAKRSCDVSLCKHLGSKGSQKRQISNVNIAPGMEEEEGPVDNLTTMCRCPLWFSPQHHGCLLLLPLPAPAAAPDLLPELGVHCVSDGPWRRDIIQ